MEMQQMIFKQKIIWLVVACISLDLSPTVYPQNITIETEKLTKSVYVLKGAGGNIGVSVGEDDVFIIDDQYAKLTEKIQTAISKISDKSVRFIINTHYHFDHTGGNENFGESGAVIIAHENLRKRLSTNQFIEFFQQTQKALTKIGLPVITFTSDLTLHINGDEMYVFHPERAHTDGDAVIYFRNANVIHMGDIYFEESYPLIDLSGGGSVNGVIKATQHILNIIDEQTKVIPGHGNVTNKQKLKEYLEMLITVRNRIQEQFEAGKSLQEIIASKPTLEFDDERNNVFMSPEQFIEILFKDLSRTNRN